MPAPIGIVCATQSEIAPFLKAMDVVSTDKKAMVEMHRGTFGGCDVVATCCGILEERNMNTWHKTKALALLTR